MYRRPILLSTLCHAPVSCTHLSKDPCSRTISALIVSTLCLTFKTLLLARNHAQRADGVPGFARRVSNLMDFDSSCTIALTCNSLLLSSWSLCSSHRGLAVYWSSPSSIDFKITCVSARSFRTLSISPGALYSPAAPLKDVEITVMMAMVLAVIESGSMLASGVPPGNAT